MSSKEGVRGGGGWGRWGRWEREREREREWESGWESGWRKAGEAWNSMFHPREESPIPVEVDYPSNAYLRDHIEFFILFHYYSPPHPMSSIRWRVDSASFLLS